MKVIDEGFDAKLARIFTLQPNLLASFVKRVAVGARTDITKAVTRRYSVKPNTFRNHVRVGPVKREPEKASVSLIVAGRNLPLASFGKVRATRKGVSFQVIRGRRTVAPSAFIFRSKYGGVVPGTRTGKGRGPVRGLVGPSPAQMSSQSGVESLYGRFIIGRLEQQAAHYIKWKG